MLRIVPFPHPALRHESRPVVKIDDRLRAAVREMFDLMYAAKGIGLAANQVAIPLRFFILNLTADPTKTEEEQVFINPEIIKRHSSVEEEEGCLSFPTVYAKVRRSRKIKVKAFDLSGNPVEIQAEDLLGRAIQHETDHLHGRLFVDWLDEDDLVRINPKIREVERGFREAQATRVYPDDAELKRRLQEDVWPTLRGESSE